MLAAAEGVFGRGARGLANMIEGILRDQGEPVAYIAGQEAGGAFVFGLRYGSGTMHHQIEGQRRVYWTGPSIGFDVGGNADKVFILVYNLHDASGCSAAIRRRRATSISSAASRRNICAAAMSC